MDSDRRGNRPPSWFGSHLAQDRDFLVAGIETVGTPGVKVASRRGVDGAGNLSLKQHLFAGQRRIRARSSLPTHGGRSSSVALREASSPAIPAPLWWRSSRGIPNVLVAGAADAGVFLSVDDGAHLEFDHRPDNPAGRGVPHLPRPHFAYFDREGTNIFQTVLNLYIGTQGRGAWRITRTVKHAGVGLPGSAGSPVECPSSNRRRHRARLPAARHRALSASATDFRRTGLVQVRSARGVQPGALLPAFLSVRAGRARPGGLGHRGLHRRGPRRSTTTCGGLRPGSSWDYDLSAKELPSRVGSPTTNLAIAMKPSGESRTGTWCGPAWSSANEPFGDRPAEGVLLRRAEGSDPRVQSLRRSPGPTAGSPPS